MCLSVWTQRRHPDVLVTSLVWCSSCCWCLFVCLPPTATWSSLAMPLPQEGSLTHKHTCTRVHARPLSLSVFVFSSISPQWQDNLTGIPLLQGFTVTTLCLIVPNHCEKSVLRNKGSLTCCSAAVFLHKAAVLLYMTYSVCVCACSPCSCTRKWMDRCYRSFCTNGNNTIATSK